MYRVIHDRESVPDLYAKKVIEEGHVDENYLSNEISKYNDEMSKALTQADQFQPENIHFKGLWSDCQQASDDVATTWNTGNDRI